jgi:ABC-2 type transport system permease protein
VERRALNMNLYLREMRAHRKSLIIWCIGMVAMIGSGMGKYAGYSSSGLSINELFEKMPKSLQAFMGVGSLDMSTAVGYYGLLFMYLVLMAAIHAAMLGATIISKEERDKTAEFLFVKPIPRRKIVSIKLLAAFTNVFILAMVTWISSLLIVGSYAEGETVGSNIGITMVGMLILQVLFLLIGTTIAVMTKKPKKASSFATSVLLLTFILSFAIDLSKKLESLTYFTPFKYFEAKNVMYGGGFEPVYLTLSSIVIVLLFLLTFSFYNKRDLNV